MAIHPIETSYQTKTLFELPRPVIAKTDPMRSALRDEVQDRALDTVGCHGSAVTPWHDSRTADQKHDDCLVQARLSYGRGEYAMADYWVEQAQHWDAQEDALLDRVWALFGEAADAARHIVAWVERLCSVGAATRRGGRQG